MQALRERMDGWMEVQARTHALVVGRPDEERMLLMDCMLVRY